MEDLTGKQLGAYRIIEPLGEGGMAAVYKAYQASMDRYVALKILPRDFARDPEFIARFQREARVIGQLEHPHILAVHDFGEADNYTYLVMRLVSGGDLTGLLAKRAPALDEISRAISEIASALDYAHAKGVIHRDIKPSNVLIDDQGSCLLSDFGLAKMMIADARFTASGAFIGTPTYASPEQCMGYELDARTDIYSLGVMLYEMCTGRPPFRADTPMGIVLKHVNDPLPLPRSINPGLPEPVERVLLKALAKDREERYQTAGALAEALRKAVARPDVLAAALGEAVARPDVLAAALGEAVARSGVLAAALGEAVARSGVLAAGGGAGEPMGGGISASTGGTTPVSVPPPLSKPIETTLVPKPGLLKRFAPAIAVGVLVVALAIFALLSLTSKQNPSTPTGAPSAAAQASDPPLTQVAGVEKPAAPETKAPQPTEPPSPTEAQVAPTGAPAGPASSGSWLALGDLPRTVNSFVLDPASPRVIYAATGDYTGSGAGIYKSADTGITWQKISQNLPNDPILTLAILQQAGQRTFLASSQFGMFSSSDEGATWAEASSPGSMGSEPAQMIVAGDGQTVYAIMQNSANGLARSQNGGQTWEPLNSGLPKQNDYIYLGALAIDPANPQVLYAGMGQFSGHGDGVYKSTDGGETWSPSNKGMLDYGVSALAIDSTDPQVIYAGCETGELFKSSDAGQTWTNITAKLAYSQTGGGHRIRGIRIDPQTSMLYLLADYTALQISKDGGEAWKLTPLLPGQDQPYYGAWNLLMGEKPGDKPVLLVALQSWGGSWRYSEEPVAAAPAGTPTLAAEAASAAKISGAWQSIGDLPRQVNAFAVDPSEPKRILAATGSGIFRSEDGGQTWQASSAGLDSAPAQALAFSSGDRPMVFTTLQSGGSLYASQDGGQSWSARGNVGTSCTFECRLVPSPADPNDLFFISADGSARSTDGGQTWLPFGDGLPRERDQVLLVSLAFDPTNPDILYGGTGGFVGNGQGVYKSTDGGETWAPSNKGMLDYKISALAVDPRNPQVVYAGGYDGDLFKSSDGGQTWANLKDRLVLRQHGEPRAVRALRIDPANGLVYLLGDNSGLLYTNDGGAKWRMVGNPPGTEQPRYETLAVQEGAAPAFFMAIMDKGGAWRFGE